MEATKRLHNAIAAVAPIVGVSVGTEGVSASVSVLFEDIATSDQRAAAQIVVNEFRWTEPEYQRKRAAEWAASPWNAAAQNSAMIKWFRGDASEITALSQFDLSVRAKHPKPGA